MIRPLIAQALAAALLLGLPAWSAAQALASVPAQAGAGTAATSFDGVVEAVHQAVVAAQVAGAVVQLEVKVGDRVKPGQVLLRIDARAADQNTAASDAQVQAARAALEMASKEFERQQQLFEKKYISKAALERAESGFKSAQAQTKAQLAQAGAARTQGNFYIVRAPFTGVVTEVPVSLGDMAMPGRPLLSLYDPAALRVTANVPQSVASRLAPGQSPRIEVPGLPTAPGVDAMIVPERVQLLPTVDAATHTVQLRADLPPALAGVAPGMFARVWLPLAATATGGAAASVSVPLDSVVRRAEMTGLYVLDTSGKPVLRQVRLGRSTGDRVEILSGVTAGERVVTDPQAAARIH